MEPGVGLHLKERAIKVEELAPEPLHLEGTLEHRHVETEAGHVEEVTVLDLADIDCPRLPRDNDLRATLQIILGNVQAAGQVAACSSGNQAERHRLP
jgi:hypothetical protein